MVDGATRNDAKPLLDLDMNTVENAGQCGFRPIMTMLGCLDGMNVTAKKLCYEAPFGVGYLTVRYDIA